MTAAEATALGYELVEASAFELGLLKNGQGLRTWWKTDGQGRRLTLDHPLVMEAIGVQEGLERQWASPKTL